MDDLLCDNPIVRPPTLQFGMDDLLCDNMLLCNERYNNPYVSATSSDSGCVGELVVNEKSVVPFSSTSCDRAFNRMVELKKATKADSWATSITCVGQDFFGGRDEARLCVEKYNYYWGRKIKVVKSDSTRYTVECVYKEHHSCKWRFHALSISSSMANHLVLRDYHDEHTCCAGFKDNPKNAIITRALVKSLIMDQIKTNYNRRPCDIVKDFKGDYGLLLSYDQAHAGKEECLKELYGDHSESYTDLLWFVDAVRMTNEGSVADLVMEEGTNQFKSLFLSFEACIFGFQFCRPVLFLDATFLTGKFRGCLMAAAGKNANQGIFPLAYGIISGENVDNWNWFLKKLRSILSDRTLTFISDRHDGLVNGIAEVFPGSHHTFCYYHLKNNVRCQIKKKKEAYGQAMNLFTQCFYSSTFEGYYDGMKKLNDMGCTGLHEYLSKLPIEKWSTAHCKGCRYGDMCSNVVESFNSWIRETKSLPIGTLVNQIRIKIMGLMNKRRVKGSDYKGYLCPKLEKRVEKAIQTGSTWTITSSSDFQFEVNAGMSHAVDLSKHYCSCRVWFTEQFPCDHVIVCILSIKHSVYQYVNPYYNISYFQASYSHSMKPIPNDEKPITREVFMLPPEVTGKKHGRPKKKRIPNTGSVFTRAIKCGNCGMKARHNRTTCPNPPGKK